MAKSKAEQAEVDKRREQLIKLRRKKVPFDDQRILSLGYSSRQHASKDFYRAVIERKEATEAEAAAYREEQAEVIEALFETYMPLALDGDAKAAKLVLELMERQAKLRGLDAVLKAEFSGPDGGAIPLGATLTELNNLIATAGELGPASQFQTPDPDGEDDDGNDS